MSPQTSQTFLRFWRRASRIIINCRRKIQFQPIHSYLSKRNYPPHFTKEDKRALRKSPCMQCLWSPWQSIRGKSSRKWARFRTPHQRRGCGRFSWWGTATRFFASLAAAPSFLLIDFAVDFHGVVAAFWLFVFAFVFAPVFQLFLTHSHRTFLPFWRWDSETTSAATALETINLCECTQLFANCRVVRGF